MKDAVQGYRPAAGDVVEVSEHRVGESRRTGEVLEVIGSPPNEHFRVLWDDGSESIFYPSNDALVRPRRVVAKP